MQAISFGDTMRRLRHEKGVGIKTAAPYLDVSYTYLSKIENDKAVPSGELIERMANYYGADRDELFALADRIPDDVRLILRENPVEAADLLRQISGTPRDSSVALGARNVPASVFDTLWQQPTNKFHTILKLARARLAAKTGLLGQGAEALKRETAQIVLDALRDYEGTSNPAESLNAPTPRERMGSKEDAHA